MYGDFYGYLRNPSYGDYGDRPPCLKSVVRTDANGTHRFCVKRGPHHHKPGEKHYYNHYGASPDVPMWTSGRIYRPPSRGVPGIPGAHGYGAYGARPPCAKWVTRTDASGTRRVCVQRAKPFLEDPVEGYGAYGVVLGWVPKKGRLAKCEEMRFWYDKFITAHNARLKNCKWPRLGSCGTGYGKKMRQYEKNGKGAWKECKKRSKLETAEATALEMEDLESGTMLYDPSTDPFTGETIALPGVATGVAATDIIGTTATAEEGPNVLLWAGLGAAGLLGLIFFLRRQD